MNISDKLAPVIKDIAKKIFTNEKEQQNYYKFAMTVITNNESILKLDKTKVNACIFQMYMRGVKPDNQEAYIIPYIDKETGEYVPNVQNGYKFALRKLLETGEFKDEPLTFDLHKDEFIEMDPHNRDVKYKKIPITSYEEFEKRQKSPIFGWVVQLKLTNLNIEKFYFDQEIVQHMETWSKAYRAFKNGGEKFGVFKTNMYEMKRKTAFMRVYTNYLPKTEAIMKAINDINALNNASYFEISKDAVPVYLDNPNNDNKKNKITKNVHQDVPLIKPELSKSPPKAPPKIEKKKTKEEKPIELKEDKPIELKEDKPIELKLNKNLVPEKNINLVFGKLNLFKDQNLKKQLGIKLFKFIEEYNKKQGYQTNSYKEMTWETFKQVHKLMEQTLKKYGVPEEVATINIDYPNNNDDPLAKIKSDMEAIK